MTKKHAFLPSSLETCYSPRASRRLYSVAETKLKVCPGSQHFHPPVCTTSIGAAAGLPKHSQALLQAPSPTTRRKQ